MDSITSHRSLQLTVHHQVCSTYTDHSQDPIEDVLCFFYGPSPIVPGVRTTTERATETSKSNEVTDTSRKRSHDQSESEEEFHLLARGSRAPFPWLLYCLLEDSMANDTDEIISWGEYGRSFQVHDRKAFETRIMPR